ncbi:MAG: hypothetical protein ACLSFZ_07615 [Frisingicoccus sp.]
MEVNGQKVRYFKYTSEGEPNDRKEQNSVVGSKGFEKNGFLPKVTFSREKYLSRPLTV